MFDEAIEAFEAMVEKKSEQWLYDNYIPVPGTYILLNIEDGFSLRNIVSIGKPDRKTGDIPGMTNKDYDFVSYLDKNSKLITMNKAMDTGKIIHSNNVYSFFVKKESLKLNKLEEKNIEGYYSVLANPHTKYKKNKAKQIYDEVETKLDAVNVEMVNCIKQWIQQNLMDFLKDNEIDLESKDYLKIFFIYSSDEKTKSEVKKEGERYLLPNIYNNNDYNVTVNHEIFGLHSNNMGLNAKKPYLDNKSRRITIPCAITMDKAILQYRFMEYLSSQASQGNYNVYIDLDKKDILCVQDKMIVDSIESGLYFRIKQGKTEVEIYAVERITGYKNSLKNNFRMRKIFELSEKMEAAYSDSYGTKYYLYEIERLVNEGLFGKWLMGNYKTAAGELPSSMNSLLKEQLLLSREQLWNWFHNNECYNVPVILNKACKCMIRDSVENGYLEKAKHQFNLWFSLTDYLNENRRKEEHMSEIREQLLKHVVQTKEDWEFESDDEYYFAVGQVSKYILGLSKKSKADQKLDMLRPIFSVKEDDLIKKRLVLLMEKYDHAIRTMYGRTNELLAKVLTYKPTEKVNDAMILAGYLDKSVIYMSNENAEEK